MDTQVLYKALNEKGEVIDVGHTGTAMRFLTAYFSIQEDSKVILRGSKRMHQRPIAPLVNALKDMGAHIEYLDKLGYPPLFISGQKLNAQSVEIDGSMSSQYVTALLLIAPALENGLKVQLKGKITSLPYIEMTLKLLQQIGVMYTFNGNTICVAPYNKSKVQSITVESDWSSASYLYSFFAISKMKEMRLKKFSKDSLQGDSKLQELYRNFGVESLWDNDDLVLQKTFNINSHLTIDCSRIPDLAQTIAVTAFALGVSLKLLGLHTLKIKETDRLVALQNELQKLGAHVQIDSSSLVLDAREKNIKEDILIETYQDHRMAMAFACLAATTPIRIQNPEVVKKSFIDFWEVWKQLGISCIEH